MHETQYTVFTWLDASPRLCIAPHRFQASSGAMHNRFHLHLLSLLLLFYMMALRSHEWYVYIRL